MKYFLLFITFLLLLSSCGKTTSPAIPAPGEEEIPSIQVGWEGAGTEPFWAFRYTGGSLTWQEPGENDVLSYTATGAANLDEQSQAIQIVAGNFSGTLVPETCSDGMSDNVYAYKITVQKDTRSFS